MLKKERYYDGYGNELHIDETHGESIRISVNDAEIIVPTNKLMNMLKHLGEVKGKHVKHPDMSEYETR